MHTLTHAHTVTLIQIQQHANGGRPRRIYLGAFKGDHQWGGKDADKRREEDERRGQQSAAAGVLLERLRALGSLKHDEIAPADLMKSAASLR